MRTAAAICAAALAACSGERALTTPGATGGGAPAHVLHDFAGRLR